MINQLFTKPLGLLTTPANWGNVKLSRLFSQAGKIAAFSATLGSINYFTPAKALAKSSSGPSEEDVALMLKNANTLAGKLHEMHQEMYQYRKEDQVGQDDSFRSAAIFITFHMSNRELQSCFSLPVPDQQRIEGTIGTCNLFIEVRKQYLKTVKDYCGKSRLLEQEIGKIYSKQNVDKLTENEFSLVESRIAYLKQLQGEGENSHHKS